MAKSEDNFGINYHKKCKAVFEWRRNSFLKDKNIDIGTEDREKIEILLNKRNIKDIFDKKSQKKQKRIKIMKRLPRFPIMILFSMK